MPENTLASFARALADGAAILESDVHLTRDGVPVFEKSKLGRHAAPGEVQRLLAVPDR